MSEGNGQSAVVDESMVYDPMLTAVSTQERVAYERMAHWRKGAIASWVIALGLLVVVVILLTQRQHRYTQVGITEQGLVRLTPLDQAWTLSHAQVREQLAKWILACRSFGTDEYAIPQSRLLCWNMAKKPAQAWIGAQFAALPIKEVGKVAIRVAQPPLPPMRFVPPYTGRTWEVYWQEEWSVVNSPVVQRKAFLALITVQVKEPTEDHEVHHMGVWIEHITVEERPAPESNSSTDRPH